MPKHNGGRAIQRFNRVDRVNHAFVIISFFGLTITGLPLLYADHKWAVNLMTTLGGVNSAGILHRIFALMLIGNFVVHGVGIVNRIRKYGIKTMLFGPYTMMPRLKDFQDCLGMWKWFFKGGKKP
jgi:cytochrome b subunit of formate dehydrogenase